MTSQQTLPFFDFSNEDRLRFAQLVNDKPLPDRARKFFRLAYDAATEWGKPGLQVRYYDHTLLVSCPQERLAELLECSVRTVQRMIDEQLVPTGIVEKEQVVPECDGPSTQKTVYLIFMDRLQAMPSLDPTNELDCVIIKRGGDLRQSGERVHAHPELQTETSVQPSPSRDVAPVVVSDVVPDVVCPVVSVVAQDVAPVVVSNVVSLMNHDHDHEGMNEFKINHSITHDHEEPPPKRFDAITARDVLAIAGYAFDRGDGQMVTANGASRLRALMAYFDDALANGLARPGEEPLFTALFRCAARLHRLPSGNATRVNDVGGWIRRCWENRDTKPPGRVTAEDRAYARSLLTAQSVPSA